MLADIGAADFVVAHNAKFELQWLLRCGVDLRKILPCCTFLAEWVIHGNIKVEMSLAATAKRYGVPPKLDLVSKLIDSGYPVEDIPSSWLLEYCQRDVETTLAVFEQQRRILEETNRLHIWHTRNLTCAVLADIEANGMRLDETLVNEEYSRVTKRHDELKKELESFCGGINLASPKQVAEFLYDKLGFAEGRERTPTGGRKADAETLLGLKAVTPEQRRFKELYGEYRNLDSLLSKNLNFFKGVVDEREGLFYAQFNQGRTATHRLASSGRSIWLERGGKQSGVNLRPLAVMLVE